MGILLWIALGATGGAMARWVMPGPKAGGIPMGILLGLAGSLIGGVLGTFLAGGLTVAIDVRSAIMAFTGTLLVLLSYRAFALRFEKPPWENYAQRESRRSSASEMPANSRRGRRGAKAVQF